jgi:signal transduction histidine kinase
MKLPLPRQAGRIAGVFVGLLLLVGLYGTSLYSYLLFHSIAELFSIVVAWGIFALVWNARPYLDSPFFLFVGIAYLFVGWLDLLHTLAYSGMGVFPGRTANLPTQLWIAARYLQSLSLLAASLLRRKLSGSLLVVGYALLTALLTGLLLVWGVFPDCYVEGVGLTTFKKVSEYVISLILVASAAVLVRRRADYDEDVLRVVVASIVVTVLSELAFTLYAGVYDLANLAGHFFKIISFYLVYKAIIEMGFTRPYHLLFRSLKQSEQSLRERTVDLQARNEELAAFAHTVAHDLRNPITVVVGLADTLREYLGQVSVEDLKRHLKTISWQARKMSDVVESLLLLAEVRKAHVDMAPLAMAEIVAEVRQRLASEIERTGADLVLPETWPPAWGFAPWIEEVWVNLIENALEHGGSPPSVTLGATERPDGMVRFWVRDHGPGIAPEEQVRLFVPFARFAQDRARHGFGLSIVRRIIDRLGGQVGVESEVGAGSTFWFALPAR